MITEMTVAKLNENNEFEIVGEHYTVVPVEDKDCEELAEKGYYVVCEELQDISDHLKKQAD